MSLPAHQLRVLDERAQLAERIAKLEAFISGGFNPPMPRNAQLGAWTPQPVAEDEQKRLRRQLAAMREYHDVLLERIGAFAVHHPEFNFAILAAKGEQA